MTNTIHGFKSEAGDQHTYYFTDAATEEQAKVEAISQSEKFFGKRVKISKLKTDFQSLPEHAPQMYKWFIGVKGQWK